jgi:hypothetical protein
MIEDPLYIDGKLVTANNARRFVTARAPHAKALRETYHTLQRRSTSVVVTAPWGSVRAKTAGEAWLSCARRMVTRDAEIAAAKAALKMAVAALVAATTPNALEVAALQYAAERIRQTEGMYGNDRKRMTDVLTELAAGMKTHNGE